MNAHDMLQQLDLDDDTVTDPSETRWAWLFGVGTALVLIGLVVEVFALVVCDGKLTADEGAALIPAWAACMVGIILRGIADAVLSGIDLRARWLQEAIWVRGPAAGTMRSWASVIAQPSLAGQVRRLAALVSRSQVVWTLPEPITMRLDTPSEGDRTGPIVDDDVPYIGSRHVVIAWPLANDCYVSFAIDEEPRMSHWEVFDAKRDLVLAIGPLASRDVPIEDLLRRAAEGV